MSEELKRYNSIGSLNGLLFLISIIRNRGSVELKEITNRCMLERGVRINVPATIAFLIYIKIIKQINNKRIGPSEFLEKLTAFDSELILNVIIERTISKLFEDNIFETNCFVFDKNSSQFGLKISTFPLSLAIIRNFLIQSDVLYYAKDSTLIFSPKYSYHWEICIKDLKKKVSLEELKSSLEKKAIQGENTEKFVLKLERERLPEKAGLIKQISNVDVSAGFDIVSFKNKESTEYDRFIEVKSYIGEPHFYWSKNEYEKASLLGDLYILCLVNYERIGEQGYQPEFINNPINVIENSPQWMISPASFKVEKI